MSDVLDLPNGWVQVAIADIGKVISGGTPSTKESSYWGGDISWISPSDLTKYSNKYISKGAKSITPEGLKKSSATIMPAGSIHFSSRAPIGYTVISSTNITTNQGFKSLVPADGVFNEYIYYYFKSAKQLAESKATGTTFKEISGAAFSKLPIPLPPTNEQRRIVAKIEELFSELDKGIETLKTAQAQLKVYRQALLKHAFEGNLTVQWREKNKAKLEGTDALQKKLSSQSIKRINLDKDIVGFKINFFKEIPSDWVVATIQNIAIVNPAYKKSDINDTDLVNFVPMASVNAVNGFINIEKLRAFGEVKKGFTSFAENDVIFAKITPCMENGKMAIIPKLIKNIGFGSTEFHVLQPSELVESRFLYFYISSEIFRSDAEHNMTGAVGQKRVPTNYIKASEIPLPCIVEQFEIGNLLEEKNTEIDQLDLTITTSLRQADALRQSILKKAFSGQLVPQDTNDEPASELLARIKIEQLGNKIRAKS